MKRSLIAIAAIATIAALGATVADPATARVKQQRAKPVCADQAKSFSFDFLLSPRAPEPNGCAPPVMLNGQYVGQDPDPFIRMQLNRDPATGYLYNYN